MEPIFNPSLPETLPTPIAGVSAVYIPCPNCRTYFKNWQGFTEHMSVDHWWDWRFTENYWENHGPGQETHFG
jgi:hypothetical protein